MKVNFAKSLVKKSKVLIHFRICGGKKWYWGRFFSDNLGCPLSVSFHEAHTDIHSSVVNVL